jgi:tRNA pseudouridine55 synthase
MDSQDDVPEALEGVLVIDKPTGPTSHDVVFKLRRILRMKRIGHAGTLDPLASGVLVVLLGQATKLGPYLTLHDKRYEARVVFGRSTDTLDAQGQTTHEAPIPDWLTDEIGMLTAGGSIEGAPRLQAVIAQERSRTAQTPPAYSAIKVGGQKSYDRARRGEEVVLEDRPVEVSSLVVSGAGFVEESGLPYLDLTVDVSKGYYVRSLARDLGLGAQGAAGDPKPQMSNPRQTLGVPSFLGALRRVRSGPFEIAESARLDAERSQLEASVIPVPKVAERCMSTAVLTAQGVVRASQGKLLEADDFTAVPSSSEEAVAWFSPEGVLVAIGGAEQGRYIVRRGFPVGRTAHPAASRV